MATQGYQPNGNEHHLHPSMHHHGGYDQWNQGQAYYDPNNMAYAQTYGYGAYGGYHHQGHAYYEQQALQYQQAGYYSQPGVYQQYENGYNEQNSFLPSDCSDCVYISGLPTTVKKEELVTMFAQAGKIKISKGTNRIFLFLDRKTKEPIGSATVTYQSAESAKRAIELFHNKTFNDGPEIINVQIATPDQKNPFAEMLRRQSEANSVFPNPPMNGYHAGRGPSHRAVNGQQQQQRPRNPGTNQHYRNGNMSAPQTGRNMRNGNNSTNGYKNHSHQNRTIRTANGLPNKTK